MQFGSHIEVAQEIVSEKIHKQNKAFIYYKKIITDANNIVSEMVASTSKCQTVGYYIGGTIALCYY